MEPAGPPICNDFYHLLVVKALIVVADNSWLQAYIGQVESIMQPEPTVTSTGQWKEPSQTEEPTAFRFALAISIVTLFALLLRLYGLDSESLFVDELRQVSSYSFPWRQVVSAAADQVQPPLDYLIGAALDRLGLSSDWWVRLPAAVFGTGSVALLTYWAGRMCGLWAGVVTGILLSLSPLHVAMSQEARPYTIFVFFGLLTVLAWNWAWQRDTKRAWTLFSAALYLLLLTRWDAPHWITLGLLLFVIWSHWSRAGALGSVAPPQRKPGISRRALVSMGAAYVFYAPVFIVIWRHATNAVSPSAEGLWLRAVATIADGFSAILAGYTERTLHALPSGLFTPCIIAGLGLIGISQLIRTVFARSERRLAILLCTTLPFVVGYPIVYALLTHLDAKPQYMLWMSIPLFTGIGVFVTWMGAPNTLAIDAYLPAFMTESASVDHCQMPSHNPDGVVGACHLATQGSPPRRATLGFRTMPRWGMAGRCCRTLLSGAVFTIVAVPMLRGSWHQLTTLDKRDWRGALTFLREHAAEGDALAVVASDTCPPVYHPIVPGQNRYFRKSAGFLPIEWDTRVDTLDRRPWSDSGNQVWVLCHNSRMYRDEDQIPTPSHVMDPIRVHPFHGLFVLEYPPSADASITAADRLMLALTGLLAGLPDDAAVSGPAMFCARRRLFEGRVAEAHEWSAFGLNQCSTDDERHAWKAVIASTPLALVAEAYNAHQPRENSLPSSIVSHVANPITPLTSHE